MAKRIVCRIGDSDLSNAIKELYAYRDSLAENTKNMGMILGGVAQKTFNSAYKEAGNYETINDSNGQPSTTPIDSATCLVKTLPNGKYGYDTTITCTGKDLLFVEFGTGIHYNGAVGNKPHPGPMINGVPNGDFPYAIGKYPSGSGDSAGKYDTWHTPFGTVTHGIKAIMPCYRSANQVHSELVAVAKSEFWSNK